METVTLNNNDAYQESLRKYVGTDLDREYGSDERYETAYVAHKRLDLKPEVAYDDLPQSVRDEDTRLRNLMDLERARTLADGLVRGKINPVNAIDEIEQILEYQGLDFSALDPDGKESADQIMAKLERGVKNTHIMSAIDTWVNVQNGKVREDAGVHEIRQNLAAAGVGAEVLDLSGKKSRAEMEVLLEEMAKGSPTVEASNPVDRTAGQVRTKGY